MARVAWSFAYFFLRADRVLRDATGARATVGGGRFDPAAVVLRRDLRRHAGADPGVRLAGRRYPRRIVVPAVYAFFIARLLGVRALVHLRRPAQPEGAGYAVLRGVSVFNLFVVSVF